MVEPPRPEVRARMLKNGTEEEIAEYERLLTERFDRDPSIQKSDEEEALSRTREERLRILGEKLFRSP